MTDSEKLDLLLQEITEVKRDVAEVKRDVEETKKDVAEVKRDVEETKRDVAEVKRDVEETKSDVKGVKNKLSGLELHIENVTDRNIQTVAEGHLDLSRKLDDALKVENEKEMLIIKVRILEEELKKVKARLDEIA